MNDQQHINFGGILAAFSTPVLLGMAPIFGKLAISAGADAFSVAAFRTLVAVGLLWIVYLLFFRRFLFIYPAGLLGCLVIGTVNGISSLFYYGGLSMLDASLVQLLNGLYLAFAVLLSRIGGNPPNGRTLVRVALAMTALLIITGFGGESISWLGVGLMLGSALLFAATMILSQYVVYEMPAQTAALYILTQMGIVVTMVWVAVGERYVLTDPHVLENILPPIIVLGITTALSRLAMFASVKFLGSLQTAANAIVEIGVALVLAALVLGDSLTGLQWVGVGILTFSILLIRPRDLLPRGFNPTQIIVANMSSVQFQRIAFHRAFGTREQDNEEGVMATITAEDLIAIQRMMGASNGPIDPFPIGSGAYSVDLSSFLKPENMVDINIDGKLEAGTQITIDITKTLPPGTKIQFREDGTFEILLPKSSRRRRSGGSARAGAVS